MTRQFDLKPSRYLAATLVLALSGTLALLWILSPPWWVILLVTAALLGSAFYYLRHDAFLSMQSSYIKLQLEADQITVTARNGQSWTGHVLHDSFITPAITLVNILPQGAHFSRSVIILPDSLDADSFRELRVWMKWNR